MKIWIHHLAGYLGEEQTTTRASTCFDKSTGYTFIIVSMFTQCTNVLSLFLCDVSENRFVTDFRLNANA